MRNAVIAFAAFALALSVRALAAETYLGTVVNADAGTGSSTPSNLTTATPFIIPGNALLTIQPSAAAYVCVDGAAAKIDAGIALSDGGLSHWTQYFVPTCSSTLGVKVAADTAFPTACGPTATWTLAPGTFDGGTASCAVTCVPVSGASVSCPVWSRNGREF